jgi:hypothetical protein
VWDITRQRIYQVIEDDLERWGQITCILWLPGISDYGDTLCFGTGRGLVLIYQQTTEGASEPFYGVSAKASTDSK